MISYGVGDLGLTTLVAGIILVFSLVYWLTSKDSKCWYRRYMLPLMVASLAVVLPAWHEKIAVLVSAAFIYDGLQGYGVKKKEKKE